MLDPNLSAKTAANSHFRRASVWCYNNTKGKGFYEEKSKGVSPEVGPDELLPGAQHQD